MERIIITIAFVVLLAVMAILWIETAPPAKPEPLKYERTNVQFPGFGTPVPAKYLEV